VNILLLLTKALPWQVWAGGAVLLATAFYGHLQYSRGFEAAVSAVEQRQRGAADAAQREVDRLGAGSDRSRVQQFDRD
jgi:hypothetical protein